MEPLCEKKREKTGWMKERKTTWAPLCRCISPLSSAGSGLTHEVWGRAIQRIRTNLKV